MPPLPAPGLSTVQWDQPYLGIPFEVFSLVVEKSDEYCAWMLVCKSTYHIALGALVRTQPTVIACMPGHSVPTRASLEMLISDMEYDGSPENAPFGRGEKLQVLRELEEWTLDLSYGFGEKRLHDAGKVIIPRARRITINTDPLSRKAWEADSDFIIALTTTIHPTPECHLRIGPLHHWPIRNWVPEYPLPSIFDEYDGELDLPLPDIRFAGGAVPATFTQQVGDMISPMVCYGCHNVVRWPFDCQDVESIVEKIMVPVFSRRHEELDPQVTAGKMEAEELRLRDATTWEWTHDGGPMMDSFEELWTIDLDLLENIVNGVVSGMPMMEGRVTIRTIVLPSDPEGSEGVLVGSTGMIM
ncbi:hypothetical protein IAT38_006452 [Cryptococcus sp. DSM 104549]